MSFRKPDSLYCCGHPVLLTDSPEDRTWAGRCLNCKSKYRVQNVKEHVPVDAYEAKLLETVLRHLSSFEKRLERLESER